MIFLLDHVWVWYGFMSNSLVSNSADNWILMNSADLMIIFRRLWGIWWWSFWDLFWEPLGPSKSAGQAPHVPFLVLVGETMERLSGGWHPSCVHRVKRSEAWSWFLGHETKGWDMMGWWELFLLMVSNMFLYVQPLVTMFCMMIPQMSAISSIFRGLTPPSGEWLSDIFGCMGWNLHNLRTLRMGCLHWLAAK